MKYVSLLLHIYQPPTQDPFLVGIIDQQCYTPLSRLLRSTGSSVGLNINYSLTEQLEKLGSPTIENLAGASAVEFTDSGAYHPIFPLIQPDDVVRQLRLNREGNRRILGSAYSPGGVFPPEMAYSGELPGIFRELGYRWTVTDDVPWSSGGRCVPFDRVPSVDGMGVLLRSNFWSNRISFHGEDGAVTAAELMEGLRAWSGNDDAYILIAMDGETFGHHRPGTMERFLEPFIGWLEESAEAELVAPGRLPEIFPPLNVPVPSGSWSTTPGDVAAGIPWPLWDHPANPVHEKLWSLVREVKAAADAVGSERVAKQADKMLYSCPFWWASEGRFDAVQVRRGVLTILKTAEEIYAETGDRGMLDGFLTSAFTLPVVTGEETSNAEEEG